MRTLSIRSLLRSSVLPLGLALGLSACGPEQASATNPICFADPSETQGVVCFTEPWDVTQPWDVVQTTLIQADSVEAQLVIRDNPLVSQGGTPWDVAPAVIIRDKDGKRVAQGDGPWDAPWDVQSGEVEAQGDGPWDAPWDVRSDEVSAMGETPWDAPWDVRSDDVKSAVIIRGAPAALVIRDLTANYPSLELACDEVTQGLTFCRAE